MMLGSFFMCDGFYHSLVGDVKAAQFNSKKGKLTKLVYNAGWFELKRQLTYKCKNVLCGLA